MAKRDGQKTEGSQLSLHSPKSLHNQVWAGHLGMVAATQLVEPSLLPPRAFSISKKLVRSQNWESFLGTLMWDTDISTTKLTIPKCHFLNEPL